MKTVKSALTGHSEQKQDTMWADVFALVRVDGPCRGGCVQGGQQAFQVTGG